MKVWKIQISSCAECPGATVYRCSLMKMKPVVKYVKDVPDWCPLEDYE